MNRWWRMLSAAVTTLCVCAIGAPGETVFSFDAAPLGGVPPGWSQHHHGAGKAVWKVVHGDQTSSNVLAQVAAENPNRHFNLAVYDKLQARDVELSVRFKAISGKLDRGGGFVWRYRDEGNHYIVRANPLENNVVLYKMEAGVRTDLPLLGQGRTYGVKVPEMATDWHTLRLVSAGSAFTVFLDGKQLFRVQDDTFREAGKVGLWTKADAVTWFDDFTVKATEPDRK